MCEFCLVGRLNLYKFPFQYVHAGFAPLFPLYHFSQNCILAGDLTIFWSILLVLLFLVKVGRISLQKLMVQKFKLFFFFIFSGKTASIENQFPSKMQPNECLFLVFFDMEINIGISIRGASYQRPEILVIYLAILFYLKDIKNVPGQK